MMDNNSLCVQMIFEPILCSIGRPLITWMVDPPFFKAIRMAIRNTVPLFTNPLIHLCSFSFGIPATLSSHFSLFSLLANTLTEINTCSGTQSQ